jgi:DNA-binding response OmpR family regulator
VLNKIVVAEDDDAIAHMVNMALGDAGYLCLRARNGDEAINLVRVQSPDLLILDVMMPRCDGMEVVKRLRSDVLSSKTPVLMLTALSTIEHKLDGFEAGADDYVTKPFDLRELAARAKALIRASRRERERSPTTGLPGSGAIEAHVARLLSEGAAAAVIHVHVVAFDTYADDVGYGRAEEVIRALGDTLVRKSREVTDDEVFVGHLGGADFVVVCSAPQVEGLAREIARVFDANIERWVQGEAPLRLALGAAALEGLQADESERLAVRIGAAVRAAKHQEASGYVLWSPELEQG